MDLTKLSKNELLAKCEENGITKCKSKNKTELIKILNDKKLETSNKSQKNTENNNIDECYSEDDSKCSENDNKDFKDNIDSIIKLLPKKFDNYKKEIATKINNINKAGVDSSIPCTTKRVSQNSRIYLPYYLIKKNNLTLDILNTYTSGICVGISPSKFQELSNNDSNDDLDDYLINNIGSDETVSAIIVIIKSNGYSGSSKEREEKKILDLLIQQKKWKPIIKKTNANKGNDKWEGHYYYNISGGEQDIIQSWTGSEEQIFTTYKGFMSNTNIIKSVKASLIYMMLFVHDINKIFVNINDVIYYKLILENYLKNTFYINNSCYELIKQLKCFDKDNNLISPIMCTKISIDDFSEKNKLNISHNIAVSKNIILFCETNKIMLSDYRPGNLFWDFKIANMRQQDDTIEEYWLAIEKSVELRKSLY